MNAITPADQGGAVALTAPTTIMEIIARASTDPNTDVDKLERLLAMGERFQASEAKAAYTRDLATMQPRLPVIDEKGAIKNNNGETQSTYAKWEDINDAIQPILTEHGFTLSFRPGMAADGKVTVTTVLAHKEGHSDEATVTLPHDSSGSKNSVQAVGSSISYAKRYGAIGLLNITSRAPTDRDDDGEAGGRTNECLDALTAINMAEGREGLRDWRAEVFTALQKKLSRAEMKLVVDLYNSRWKKLAPPAGDNTSDDFPGDRK